MPREPQRSQKPKSSFAPALVRDASISLHTGRVMARAWSEQFHDARRESAVWAFIAKAVEAYVAATSEVTGLEIPITPLSMPLAYMLDTSASELARTLGRAASTLRMEDACFQLSACYTAMLPQDVRSAWGAYYTPPALTDRLMEMAEEAGVNWRTASVLDPACGGGAFLLPAALRMRSALGNPSARTLIDHFATHLQGFEIDPFAAWLTRAWLEIAFSAELLAADQAFPSVVKVCDSLQQTVIDLQFDLVIGNPPYGRIKLSPATRDHYRRSLYGHANLYGLFTDLALRCAKKGGVIAYVTPTSFLAGEYFKALRGLLCREAPPLAIDFVTARKGVFEDVLQETMLATYRVGAKAKKAKVHHLEVGAQASITHAGEFRLPADPLDPWLAPRVPDDEKLVRALHDMPTRLSDWGYKVSTGPLVWNRFKEQFRDRPSKGTLPVIWAEAVTSDGKFVFRAEKRNHQPHFRPDTTKDRWLMVSEPCVLLQRTTSKEQARRLIAAELPASFIQAHGGVIVENHLNMVKPLKENPKIAPAVVAMVLNSEIADRVFRCISGSVAVSAFELESLPLPSVKQMTEIALMINTQTPAYVVEDKLRSLYVGK